MPFIGADKGWHREGHHNRYQVGRSADPPIRGILASQDEGDTWTPIEADLPSLDIHGFARDPADPARMWDAVAVIETAGGVASALADIGTPTTIR